MVATNPGRLALLLLFVLAVLLLAALPLLFVVSSLLGLHASKTGKRVPAAIPSKRVCRRVSIEVFGVSTVILFA
jgi:hypothetical protein